MSFYTVVPVELLLSSLLLPLHPSSTTPFSIPEMRKRRRKTKRMRRKRGRRMKMMRQTGRVSQSLNPVDREEHAGTLGRKVYSSPVSMFPLPHSVVVPLTLSCVLLVEPLM